MRYVPSRVIRMHEEKSALVKFTEGKGMISRPKQRGTLRHISLHTRCLRAGSGKLSHM